MNPRAVLRGVSLGLLVLTLAAWAYSYTRGRSIAVTWPGPDPKLVDGAILFRIGFPMQGGMMFDGSGRPLHTLWWTSRSFTGAVISQSIAGRGVIGSARLIVIPLWLAALPMLMVYLASRRARARPGMCPSCGYDISATPGLCPECGRRAAWLALLSGRGRAAGIIRLGPARALRCA